MNSLIFSALARPLCILLVAVSLFVLYRGHNAPGGGFIGGLVAAAGFAVLALADGIETARRRMRVDPLTLVGIGLALGLASGVPGLLTHGSFLTHAWYHSGDFHIGTTLIFDVGVYLAVVGGVVAFVLRFYEEEPGA